ncbi:MAG: 5'-methylthioadenosine/adenosylhomocysteine nucleosidase [Bacteroidales bacterium]|jgi:adenosylhomocysteine nucleosidase|nr:5'-methylthioadenosine/adenosylhomocysteine nucleosidase [Bacteroidales bacterium]
MEKKTIGIMGAMPEEVNDIIAMLESPKKIEIGQRTYCQGQLSGVDVVVVFSRWGKVAASTTVSALILHFNVSGIIFTGIAGAIHSGLHVGDVVIGKRLIQHDMDASPLIPRFEIPLLGQTFFETSPTLLSVVAEALQSLFETDYFKTTSLYSEDFDTPHLFIGDIASGDQFFSENDEKEKLHQDLPTVLCVEMEGAAVAQVCREYQIPWIVIRTVSDTADEDAPEGLQNFVREKTGVYAREIIKKILKPFEECLPVFE